MHLLINDVNIYVRVNNTISPTPIQTNIGICQGDCLSAILFVLYLAKSHNPDSDHSYARPASEKIIPALYEEHNYSKYQQEYFCIAPKYADDTTWASTSNELVQSIKNTVPDQLRKRNLLVNEDKTEEFKISRLDNDWKNCKLLGSLLDTEKDINRRKALTTNAMKDLKHLFKSHRLKRMFNVCQPQV